MIALLRPYRRERIWSLTTDAQTRPLPMSFRMRLSQRGNNGRFPPFVDVEDENLSTAAMSAVPRERRRAAVVGTECRGGANTVERRRWSVSSCIRTPRSSTSRDLSWISSINGARSRKTTKRSIKSDRGGIFAPARPGSTELSNYRNVTPTMGSLRHTTRHGRRE